ncbi:MAG TPA: VIT1/CCC1 transporter family protein [Tenuifilaceae bacterium]|nr:VIT1/CCC1 transporter family protein [Tenuifilaceae bacterium]
MEKQELFKSVKFLQREELTGYKTYSTLAKLEKNPDNKKVLARIAGDEYKHYQFFKNISGKDFPPFRIQRILYALMGRFLGLTFAIKLMERKEEKAQKAYTHLSKHMPEATELIEAEEEHESTLINMLHEEKLNYAGSIVLGLNDALVELTGALAGLSLALQNTKLIAMAGAITGVAASLSMAASQYLSVKTGQENENAAKSALYTGIAYVITVVLLILPFLFHNSYIGALIICLLIAILIIFAFNFYISVAKSLNFKRRFLEMLIISLGVSAITFGIGYLIRYQFGINI